MSAPTLSERATTVGPEEAARRLGLKASTLANYRWNGGGPPYVKIGNRVRYRLSDLAEYLDEQTRASTSEPQPESA